jgi:hypothetical protein
MKITEQKKQRKVTVKKRKVWGKIGRSGMGKADNECGGTGETQQRGRKKLAVKNGKTMEQSRDNWLGKDGEFGSRAGETRCRG